MVLIICPECRKEVSDSAEICPNCGYSFKKKAIEKQEVEIREVNRKNWGKGNKLISWGAVFIFIGIVIVGILVSKEWSYPDLIIFICGVISFVVGIFLTKKGKTLKISIRRCPNCGNVGRPQTGVNNTVLFLLYCFFLIPGLIYEAEMRKRLFCNKCGFRFK